MTTEKKLVHVCHIPVRWGDMDALGHVNNTQYFRYFEQARIEWFDGMGIRFEVGDQGPILAKAGCNFKKPIVYPNRLEVRTYAGPPGHSSLPLYHELRQADAPGTLYADGESVLVWVDYRLGKSLPLPDSIRAVVASTPAQAG